jgi:hypothetical protein
LLNRTYNFEHNTRYDNVGHDDNWNNPEYN